MIRVIEQDRRNSTLAVDSAGLKKLQAQGTRIGRPLTSNIDPETEYFKIQHNKGELAELDRVIAQHNLDIEIRPTRESAHSTRIVVPEGHYRKGDKIGGRTITGLGLSWRVSDPNFYSAHGIHPSVEYVQYAYLE